MAPHACPHVVVKLEAGTPNKLSFLAGRLRPDDTLATLKGRVLGVAKTLRSQVQEDDTFPDDSRLWQVLEGECFLLSDGEAFEYMVTRDRTLEEIRLRLTYPPARSPSIRGHQAPVSASAEDPSLRDVMNGIGSIGDRLETLQAFHDVHVRQTLGYSGGKTERGDNRPFKAACWTYYHEGQGGVPGSEGYPEHLECALLGVSLPSSAVIATHLFKHEFGHEYATLFDVDLDGPRNGLLLYKPIAEAFNRLQLCFQEADDGKLRCHIIDPTLRGRSLTLSQSSVPIPPVGTTKEAVERCLPKALDTFDALEDRPLGLPLGKRPYIHVLSFHAQQATSMALRKGWPVSWEYRPFGSEGVLSDVIERWRAAVPAAPPSVFLSSTGSPRSET